GGARAGVRGSGEPTLRVGVAGRGGCMMTRTGAWGAVVLTIVVAGALAAPYHPPLSETSGKVRFFKVAKTAFDPFPPHPTPAPRGWWGRAYSRMLPRAPSFTSRLAWFPDAWVYTDLYAIYVDSPRATEHPEWILRDRDGNRLYIPYA